MDYKLFVHFIFTYENLWKHNYDPLSSFNVHKLSKEPYNKEWRIYEWSPMEQKSMPLSALFQSDLISAPWFAG